MKLDQTVEHEMFQINCALEPRSSFCYFIVKNFYHHRQLGSFPKKSELCRNQTAKNILSTLVCLLRQRKGKREENERLATTFLMMFVTERFTQTSL